MQKSRGSVAPVKATTSSAPPIRPEAHARTLRIRDIPPSVTEQDFKKYMKAQLGYEDFEHSFVPSGNQTIATVTLRAGDPTARFKINPGNTLQLAYPGVGRPLLADGDFPGMTPLYSAKAPTVDIVAITGFIGHAYESWESNTRPLMWLRDYLPLNFEQRGLKARVLTFGYDTTLRDKATAPTMQSIARTLLESLSLARAGQNERNRPIIFLGHSLGGLVIKQALAEAARAGSRESDKAVLNSCVGLYFFGVPNRGLNNENMRTLVKDQKNVELISSVKEGSAPLNLAYDNLVRAAKAELKDCQIVSFFEIADTPATTQQPNGTWASIGEMIRLVPEESATFPVPNEPVHQQIAIITGHIDMVKLNRFSQSYLIVENRLAENVKNAQKIIDARKLHA